MSEADWKEEQRKVLDRLFDSVFGCRETSEKEICRDIQEAYCAAVAELPATAEPRGVKA
jgi:hypothetical protein